ncbi:hypothetical protein V8D89_008566 [Ganoderma adspersum]
MHLATTPGPGCQDSKGRGRRPAMPSRSALTRTVEIVAGVACIARAKFDGSGVRDRGKQQGKRAVAATIAVLRMDIRIHIGEFKCGEGVRGTSRRVERMGRGGNEVSMGWWPGGRLRGVARTSGRRSADGGIRARHGVLRSSRAFRFDLESIRNGAPCKRQAIGRCWLLLATVRQAVHPFPDAPSRSGSGSSSSPRLHPFLLLAPVLPSPPPSLCSPSPSQDLRRFALRVGAIRRLLVCLSASTQPHTPTDALGESPITTPKTSVYVHRRRDSAVRPESSMSFALLRHPHPCIQQSPPASIDAAFPRIGVAARHRSLRTLFLVGDGGSNAFDVRHSVSPDVSWPPRNAAVCALEAATNRRALGSVSRLSVKPTLLASPVLVCVLTPPTGAMHLGFCALRRCEHRWDRRCGCIANANFYTPFLLKIAAGRVESINGNERSPNLQVLDRADIRARPVETQRVSTSYVMGQASVGLTDRVIDAPGITLVPEYMRSPWTGRTQRRSPSADIDRREAGVAARTWIAGNPSRKPPGRSTAILDLAPAVLRSRRTAMGPYAPASRNPRAPSSSPHTAVPTWPLPLLARLRRSTSRLLRYLFQIDGWPGASTRRRGAPRALREEGSYHLGSSARDRSPGTACSHPVELAGVLGVLEYAGVVRGRVVSPPPHRRTCPSASVAPPEPNVASARLCDVSMSEDPRDKPPEPVHPTLAPPFRLQKARRCTSAAPTPTRVPSDASSLVHRPSSSLSTATVDQPGSSIPAFPSISISASIASAYREGAGSGPWFSATLKFTAIEMEDGRWRDGIPLVAETVALRLRRGRVGVGLEGRGQRNQCAKPASSVLAADCHHHHPRSDAGAIAPSPWKLAGGGCGYVLHEDADGWTWMPGRLGHRASGIGACELRARPLQVCGSRGSTAASLHPVGPSRPHTHQGLHSLRCRNALHLKPGSPPDAEDSMDGIGAPKPRYGTPGAPRYESGSACSVPQGTTLPASEGLHGLRGLAARLGPRTSGWIGEARSRDRSGVVGIV